MHENDAPRHRTIESSLNELLDGQQHILHQIHQLLDEQATIRRMLPLLRFQSDSKQLRAGCVDGGGGLLLVNKAAEADALARHAQSSEPHPCRRVPGYSAIGGRSGCALRSPLLVPVERVCVVVSEPEMSPPLMLNATYDVRPEPIISDTETVVASVANIHASGRRRPTRYVPSNTVRRLNATISSYVAVPIPPPSSGPQPARPEFGPMHGHWPIAIDMRPEPISHGHRASSGSETRQGTVATSPFVHLSDRGRKGNATVFTAAYEFLVRGQVTGARTELTSPGWDAGKRRRTHLAGNRCARYTARSATEAGRVNPRWRNVERRAATLAYGGRSTLRLHRITPGVGLRQLTLCGGTLLP